MEKSVIEFTEELNSRLQTLLSEIDQQQESILVKAQRSVGVLQEQLHLLKDFIAVYRFKDKQEEILFFKELKPSIYKLFIYYLRIKEIESEKPTGGPEYVRKHLEKHLKLVRQHHKKHKDFYQYYRSGATHMDEQYFIRAEMPSTFCVREYFCFIDQFFFNTYCYIISKILAGEMIQDYLMKQLRILENGTMEDPAGEKSKQKKLTWKAPKAALVELIYALYATKAIDPAYNVKHIADALALVFNISLGNVYKVYEEIRLRKKDRTPFLKSLDMNMMRMMDNDDEFAS